MTLRTASDEESTPQEQSTPQVNKNTEKIEVYGGLKTVVTIHVCIWKHMASRFYSLHSLVFILSSLRAVPSAASPELDEPTR